jgi:ABC-type microcin C transport system duplicated ATPase subunit YejF
VSEPLLSVSDLDVGFDGDDGYTPVLEGVSFDLARNRTLALVGESGCGKSLTALTILGLLPPFARVPAGRIVFDGTNLLELGDAAMTRIRGNRISMIFQEPMSALNPVFTVGWQLTEALRLHRRLDTRVARQQAEAALAAVGIPDPRGRLDDYPHELSGGMRQRVMIAMASPASPTC